MLFATSFCYKSFIPATKAAVVFYVILEVGEIQLSWSSRHLIVNIQNCTRLLGTSLFATRR